MAAEQKPSPETFRHFIDYTWKDIHHSRLQNWTGITVVTAFHIGIFKSVGKIKQRGENPHRIKFFLKTHLIPYNSRK